MSSKNNLELYQNLCTEWYDLDKPLPPQDELDFYLKYAQEACGPILEPMCGSGRFLIPLLHRGFEIDGFDASDFMMNSLQKRLFDLGLKANVWKGFLEDLNTEKRFDLIFIPSGSFALITDVNAAKTCLKILKNHLRKNGRLVLEMETIFAAPPTLDPVESELILRPDGKKLNLVTRPFAMEDGVAKVLCHYNLWDEDNQIIATEQEDFKIRLYTQQEFEELLKQAGFKNITKIKAFDHSKSPETDDELVIFECS